MATIFKIPRQLAPTVGQRAAATGVKFQPGSPSTLGEKVTSGLVWRFGTFDCISDNLAYILVDDRPVGNPKRRYDEHSNKSSLSMKPRFIEPVGERTKLQKVDAC
jgi:hypothetical protein